MRQTLLIVLLAFAACGRSPGLQPAEVRALASPPARDASIGAASDGAGGTMALPETDASVEPDPRLETLLDQRERLLDWRNTVWGARADNPPVPARSRRVRSTGAFPAKGVRSVRAYLMQDPVEDEDVRNNRVVMVDKPFTSQGRLDRSVVLPDVELTSEDRAELERIVASARDDAPRISACDFSAHHVLVFFDDTGIPIGKIFVCTTCHEWLSIPPLTAQGLSPHGMRPEELQAIERILDAHGLGAWIFDERSETNAAVSAHEKRVYGTARAPTQAGIERATRLRNEPSGVDPGVSAKRASKDDRERLCTWFRAEARSPRMQDRSLKLVCPAGIHYYIAMEAPDYGRDCAAPTTCDAPMGSIEACMRRVLDFFASPTCDGSGLGPACAGLRDCVPLVHWSQEAP